MFKNLFRHRPASLLRSSDDIIINKHLVSMINDIESPPTIYSASFSSLLIFL